MFHYECLSHTYKAVVVLLWSRTNDTLFALTILKVRVVHRILQFKIVIILYLLYLFDLSL